MSPRNPSNTGCLACPSCGVTMLFGGFETAASLGRETSPRQLEDFFVGRHGGRCGCNNGSQSPLIFVSCVCAFTTLARYAHAGGQIALSGVVKSQADRVLEAYEETFDLAVAKDLEGWVLITGTRRQC